MDVQHQIQNSQDELCFEEDIQNEKQKSQQETSLTDIGFIQGADKLKSEKCQQNDINLKIKMVSLDTTHLQRLKQLIIKYDNIQTLKIVFYYIKDYNQVSLNQLISLLQNIQIQKKLKISVQYNKQMEFDIIKFAFQISKSTSIQSFSLELVNNSDKLISFCLGQNIENGQNIVSQLENMNSIYKRKIGIYSAFGDLFQVSKNINITNLKLGQNFDFIKNSELAKNLSSFYYLNNFRYRIKMFQADYDLILSLNRVLSSIPNLQKLDLVIIIQESYGIINNLLIEEELINEKDQHQNQYLKIKDQTKQYKSIEYVNLKMWTEYSGKEKEKINNQFNNNLFKIIFWSIQNVKELNVDIPNQIMEYFCNDISQLSFIETLRFEIDSNYFNGEYSDKLGSGLNKCQSLKNLQMKINLRCIQENNNDVDNNNQFIISDDLKQLSCQKSITIYICSYDFHNNVKNNETNLDAQVVDQILQILQLNNIYSLTFEYSFCKEEIISLLKNPICKINSLQTIKFILYDIVKKKTHKYISWTSREQSLSQGGCVYRCGSSRSMQRRRRQEQNTQNEIIKSNNYLKKTQRLVSIVLFDN